MHARFAVEKDMVQEIHYAVYCQDELFGAIRSFYLKIEAILSSN